MIQPETRYATVGNDRVAYQIFGAGKRDLLLTYGMWNHLDMQWDEPANARFQRRLGSFSRVIMFDRRGTGLSDRPTEDGRSQVEHWIEDCLAVFDAAEAPAPVIFSLVDSGPLVLQLIDRHPSRCSGLIFFNTTACWAERPGYSAGHPPQVVAGFRDFFLRSWGRLEFSASYVPSQAKNAAFLEWFAKYQRAMASPRAVSENVGIFEQLDARQVLSRVRIPTLVMARSQQNALIPAAQSKYIAQHVAGARFVEMPGSDGPPVWETPDPILGQIEEFVTGGRHSGEPERALLTILFTDITDSTRRAAELGDGAWRHLLDQHDQIVRDQVALHRGRFVESSGDGTLTTFNSPSHAIDCVLALQKALKSIGIEIRAGLHTGEAELREDGRVGGMAVHVGARVAALAGAGDVLVSHTVQGILTGSRYKFTPFGVHGLKGVPGEWPLYALQC